MSDTASDGKNPATKKRAHSKYWLMSEPEKVEGLMEVIEKGFASPEDAWAFAGKQELGGILHVVCHRGTRTGGSAYTLK